MSYNSGMFRLGIAFVVLAACGGATPAPAPPREPDKAAIAPPPPAPDVEKMAESNEAEPPAKQSKEEARASFDATLWPASELEVAALTGVPAKAKLSGNALVWVDAKLYVAPKDSAATIQLATLGDRKASLGHAFPMHVVGMKGDFVEIETPAQDKMFNSIMDCAWFGLETQLDVGRWRMFVKRSDIAPTISKKHVLAFADGGKLELRPGVPVVPLADGRWLVDLHSMWVPVPLPAGVVGYAYPPYPVETADKAFNPKFSLGAREVTLGDTRVKLRGMFSPLAEGVEPKGDRVVFSFGDACSSVTVVVAADQIEPYEPKRDSGSMMGGIGMGTGVGVDRWYFPVGATLVAEGGTASVKIRYELDVKRPAKTDKTVCVERYPFVASRYMFGPDLARVDANKGLKMCAPVRALKHEKGSENGFGKGLGDGGFGLGGAGLPKKK